MINIAANRERPCYLIQPKRDGYNRYNYFLFLGHSEPKTAEDKYQTDKALLNT